MHVWNFHFDEGSVQSKIVDDEEDAAVTQAIVDAKGGWIQLRGDNVDIYVNLDSVKCATHQFVTEAQIAEAAAAQEAAIADEQKKHGENIAT